MYKLKILEIDIITNFKRVKCEIANVEYIDFDMLIKVIKNKVLNNINEFKVENLFFKDNTPFNTGLLKQYILNKTLELIYKNIILPQCAKEYARMNGLIFFFHTNENNHKFYPHIHVSHNGEQISIYLKNLIIIGSFKNKKKEKEAVKYVRENIVSIMEEWKKLK